MRNVDYRIDGKVSPEVLKAIPSEVKMRVYAVRDRKVLGSSPIKPDGSFVITYTYEVFERRKERLALAPSLIFGPDLPGDRILVQRFPRVSLLPEKFSEDGGVFTQKVPQTVIAKIAGQQMLKLYLHPWLKQYCYEWRPCIQVLACSRIDGSLCYGEEPLSKARVRIYEVRSPFFAPPGPDFTALAAEGDTDLFGYFRCVQKRCWSPFVDPFYIGKGYQVEVGQIVDGMFQSVYKDPSTTLRELKSDLCDEIYVEKSKIIHPPDNPELLTGNTFKLTHIGNIPVDYINQDASSPFHGYANTLAATDSATLSVVDSAFYDRIKLYANIGAGIVDKVKYYRIKCSYESEGTTVETYIQVPFDCVRESTPVEEPLIGPYKTEHLGPIDGNVYQYPNPYDLGVDKQWIYRGLIMVLNTTTLPMSFGKYTFTLEPLDVNKAAVVVDNTAELVTTILVDNTSPEGSVGDIIGPSGQTVSSCGFLKLPYAGPVTRPCTARATSNTRKALYGSISVPFSATDVHGNLHHIVLQAIFGDRVCDGDAPITLVGNGMKPLKPGCAGTSEYENYYNESSKVYDIPLSERPYWQGSTEYCAKRDDNWDMCAYEFRLTIYKRLTNGEVRYPWWTYAKFITILES